MKNFNPTIITSHSLDNIFQFGSDRGRNFIDVNRNLNFYECEFPDEFSLVGGMASPFKKLRIFFNCTFKNTVSVNFLEYPYPIIFRDCIFEEPVYFFKVLPNEIFQENCVFKNNLDISGWRREGYYTLQNCVVEKDLSFTGIFNHIRLKNINIKSGCQPGNLILLEKLSTEHGFPFDTLTIEDSSFDNMNIGCAIAGKGIIKNTNANELNLNHVYIGLNFIIESSNIQRAYLDNVQGDEIKSHRYFEFKENSNLAQLDIALSMIDKVDISDCSFTYLRLKGIMSKSAYFNIQESEIENMEFDKVINEGSITIRELLKMEKLNLKIESSNLGKTDFIKCDFRKSTVEFHNSKITDIFPILTDFPKEISKKNSDQERLFFSQLHIIFQKQGDTIRAIEYQSREVEAYYKKIKITVLYIKLSSILKFVKLKLIWILKPVIYLDILIRKTKIYRFIDSKIIAHFTKNEYSTISALWLNKVSTSFGRNWLKGVRFTFIVAVIFFYLLIISTNNYSIGFPITWSLKLFPSFMKFMNPLRFFDTENLFNSPNNSSISLTNLSYLVDFFGRVFIAYGYFQTIQAFRKYGRK